MKKEVIQNEALDIISKYNRASVAISMGVGKTLIALRHLDSLDSKARALVVIPKLSAIDTWKSEAIKWNLEHLLSRITFTTYLSMYKQDTVYAVIYLDEAHNILHKHDEWLSLYTKYNPNGTIIGLTGTPPRYKNSEKGYMFEKYCPVVYSYDMDEAISDSILNDYVITLHPVMLDKNKTLKIERAGTSWYTSEEKSYEYWTDKIDSAYNPRQEQIARVMRMKELMSYPSKEVYAKQLLQEINNKCIVFANTHKQADKLCKHSYHSSNPNSEQNLQDFKDGKITKLSSVLQLSEGVNIPNLEEAIILHSYSANSAKGRQRIGRLLRLSVNQRGFAHILYYRNTVDESWVRTAMKDFDSSKLIWK